MYIFYILSYSYIKLHLIPPLTYPFYPPYVSTLSPQSLWITAEKVDKSVKKRFSHQEVGKSSEKRGFYISLPKKMFTLHYAILCTTMDLLWIAFTLRFVYSNVTYPFCIFLQRLFLFLVSFSPSYFGGSSAFLSPISICCGFTPLLLLPCFVSAFLCMAALSPLFFRSFDVETSL